MTALTGVAWCLAAFVAAAALAHRLVDWTWQRGMIDRPHRRRIHARPTPRGGGAAIIVVAGTAAIITASQDPATAGRLAAAGLPAITVALIGWWDDVAPRPMVVRLAVQVMASIVTVWLLGSMAGAGLEVWSRYGLTAVANGTLILWLVGLTNVFNFLDGTDGLAGVSGAVIASALAAAAELRGEHAVAAVSGAFAAACLGFLTCNWEPARIFMGDVGSTGCGFLLAALPLAAAPQHGPALVVVVALAAWPLIADATITLATRVCRGENIFEPHREHVYQRLVLAGWSHRAVAVLYGALATGGGLVALSWIAGQR